MHAFKTSWNSESAKMRTVWDQKKLKQFGVCEIAVRNFFFTDRIMTELVLDVVTEKEFSKALLQRNSWETCTMVRVWYAKEWKVISVYFQDIDPKLTMKIAGSWVPCGKKTYICSLF